MKGLASADNTCQSRPSGLGHYRDIVSSVQGLVRIRILKVKFLLASKHVIDVPFIVALSP